MTQASPVMGSRGRARNAALPFFRLPLSRPAAVPLREAGQ